MDYNGCYDSVCEIVEEASEKFGKTYKLKRDKQYFEKVCSLVDSLVVESDCDSVDVGVDMVSKQLTIGIICEDMIFENGRSNVFFSIITEISSFSFSKSKGSGVQLALNIDNVWEKVCG